MFDLGLALRKKQESETARLLDFEFRRRARAARLLAEALGVDPDAAIGLVATMAEDAIPLRIAALAGIADAQAVAAFQHWLAVAHQQLVGERGDPRPHRLA